MKRSVEQTWVGWLDSAAWRRFGRSPAGRRVLHSRTFRTADMARRFAESSVRNVKNPAMFESVRTFCLFLGTVKSGGTLVGSLLDAHPDIVLADEADPLRYVTAGFGRDQIFHILAKTSRREAMKGRVTARRLEPYAFAVPGQSQGGSARPIVVGDSRAGPTTRRLGEEPELNGRLRELLGDIDDRYIHVVRNPYDPISAMVRRGRRTLANAIEDYAGQSRRVAALRRELDPARVLTVRYEDFVASPADRLRSVCRFLGVEAESGYLSACAEIIDRSRCPERHTVKWTPTAVAAVERIVDQFAFLDGYAFTD